jgi:hypothetical protein
MELAIQGFIMNASKDENLELNDVLVLVFFTFVTLT